MTALAIGVGVLAGLCVAVMTSVVNVAHVRIFGIPFDVHLSAAERVAPLAAFGAPMLGGLLLGAIDVWLARRKAPPAVDPVEANALRGGRMSLRQSLLVATQTVISNGCGASVGLEAGYAQIGAGVASYLGVRSRLRRQDLRDAGRLRGGRRDCGGVRRAAHGRLLRFRAHHRRLFARQRNSRLRRHPRRVAHHPGDHRRALRHHSAHGRPADVRRLWRADRARPGRGGGRRRRDAGGGVDRTGVPLGDPVASHSSRRRRTDGRLDGALQPAGAGGGPRRARARLLLADDGDGVGDAHRAQAVRLPRFAGVRLSRRNVLRLAVRRLAARQALFDRRRRPRAVDGTRDHGLRAGRHGRA